MSKDNKKVKLTPEQKQTKKAKIAPRIALATGILMAIALVLNVVWISIFKVQGSIAEDTYNTLSSIAATIDIACFALIIVLLAWSKALSEKTNIEQKQIIIPYCVLLGLEVLLAFVMVILWGLYKENAANGIIGLEIASLFGDLGMCIESFIIFTKIRPTK